MAFRRADALLVAQVLARSSKVTAILLMGVVPLPHTCLPQLTRMCWRRFWRSPSKMIKPTHPPTHPSLNHTAAVLSVLPVAQVLAKSSKMIPVMLMGTVLHGKRYSALEYACCLAISGGWVGWVAVGG